LFSKILIANRGEIALRVIRACKEMGIATVAVYSAADADSLHVSLADESICIDSAHPKDSYLNMKAIISAALVTGAQAIHPGYGFLSENPSFSRLCSDCGIVFIGPPAEIIEKMGDKDEARRAMAAAGVPVVPGTDVIENAEKAHKAADEIGYPLLIKARSGGGGKGIRKVDKSEDFIKSFQAASSEADSAFGDGACYLEKFLSPVKHIEVQLLADSFGNVIALGERDCSVQRKNQKMLEESPAPSLKEEVRAQMREAAIRAAKAVDYLGAGTVEFLYTADHKFYFMEMNTRLQVEHPVTEMVTSIDLVKWQIRIAAGMEINFAQDKIFIHGCAIECRINAENPAKGYAPSCGRIDILHVPGGPNVRLDTSLYQGYNIPSFYDSMVGKLIVQARTRKEAIRKMKAALCELVVEGIDTTADVQMDILCDPDFISGEYTTDFIAKREAKAE